jgi:hypothetical protein
MLAVSSSWLGRGALPLGLLALGCGDPLNVGSDLLWKADHETGELSEWTKDGGGDVRLPSDDSTITVSSEQARSGRHALQLINPADWDNQEQGPELFHAGGELTDAYYSAWFLLPERYHIEPSLTLIRLRSRDQEGGDLYNGEELQLRSLSDGSFVLQVFSNHAAHLLEPLAEVAPRIEAGRWFQVEARFQPRSGGSLRVWLDGTLAYDLGDRPGAAGAQVVLSACNVAERATPAPLVLFVDDAAISFSRVTPAGHW